ncbi:hypothetical protein DSO57_1000177 [Entomophthora muscae]|uniref:Uncharacterized protein n=2 Tax=Entomophthora muscae TaxID=34485 RepID=A0ACC2T9G2_9FUNG|nr:hypothetical protein DSO57_1021615 [Entomophthora muscae]KAJ9071172.1 hypothetical protein DSO57_1000177 [Entomophthora muscae]
MASTEPKAQMLRQQFVKDIQLLTRKAALQKLCARSVNRDIAFSSDPQLEVMSECRNKRHSDDLLQKHRSRMLSLGECPSLTSSSSSAASSVASPITPKQGLKFSFSRWRSNFTFSSKQIQ